MESILGLFMKTPNKGKTRPYSEVGLVLGAGCVAGGSIGLWLMKLCLMKLGCSG